MRRILIVVGVVAVVALLVGLNLRNARHKGVEVDVVDIPRKSLVAQVSGSGRIEARRSVSTTASVIGKVVELAVDEGDTVTAGQLLLRIDPGDREASLEQARANLAREQAQAALADAELRQAESELRRVEALRADGLSSDRDIDSARTTRDVRIASRDAARESVRNARAGVEYAEYELSKTVFRAEIPGVVVQLSVEEGENVLAGDLYNSGSAIVVIADPSEMEAQVLVDETEVVSVRRGQRAKITVDAFPDLKLEGTVFEVGNSAYNAGPLGSQEAKDFRVRILLDEVPPAFRPGLSARADIVTDTRDSVLAVPIEALALRDPERERKAAESGRPAARRRAARRLGADEGEGATKEVEGVFLVDDGKARFVPVETGIAGEKDFEVISGLAEGDRVVRGPFDAIRDLTSGDPVRIRDKDRKKRDRADAPRRGEPGGEAGGDGNDGEDGGGADGRDGGS